MLKAANIEYDGAFHVFVEGSDDAEKFGLTSDFWRNLEEAILTDRKSFVKATQSGCFCSLHLS